MNAPVARFTQGSTLRHIVEMTVTGAIGLIAIFFVDFLSLFYVSRLGDDRLTAGVGYATSILFVAMSVNIGLLIAGTALVSRRIGAGDRAGARRVAASGVALAAITGLLVTAILLSGLEFILDRVGASGTTRQVATQFLWIVLPANVLMAIGIMFSGYLRAVADAKRAMQVTLFGGIVTAFVDPLLIFGAGLGTNGAAIATVISRLVFLAVGFHGIVRVHRMIEKPRMAGIRADSRAFFDIAIPAILTNVATPIGVLLLTRILAQFGPEAIAASAIIDRLVPLAFGLLFALSGAIGAILGQNLGAGRFDRVRMALRDALLFAGLYSLAAWLILALLRHQIAGLFGVSGITANYVAFFCLIGAAGWVFIGLLFVSNAAFNNLGFPLYSTAFNWGRATIGTVPFAWYGAMLGGFEGATALLIVGSAIFGLSSLFVAFRAVSSLERRAALQAKAEQDIAAPGTRS